MSQRTDDGGPLSKQPVLSKVDHVTPSSDPLASDQELVVCFSASIFPGIEELPVHTQEAPNSTQFSVGFSNPISQKMVHKKGRLIGSKAGKIVGGGKY